jgi:hypothetical protein
VFRHALPEVYLGCQCRPRFLRTLQRVTGW